MTRTNLLCLLGCAVLLSALASPLAAGEATTVEIKDRTIVDDCMAFGINFKEAPKRYLTLNFEGTTHRVCMDGEVFPDGFLCYKVGPGQQKYSNLETFWVGAEVTILSGPAKGQRRTVRRFEWREDYCYPYNLSKGRKGKNGFLVFDKPIAGLDESKRMDWEWAEKKGDGREVREAYEADPFKGVGALIHKDYTDVGFSGAIRGFRPDDRNKTTEPVQGDVPPGSFGQSALLVAPGDRPARLQFDIHDHSLVDCNGKYHLNFWAKAREGKPVLTVSFAGLDVPEQKVTPGASWQKYELTFDLTGKFPKMSPVEAKEKRLGADALFEIDGGAMLFDDIEMWKDGWKNPSPFPDGPVNTLKRGRFSTIRLLQEGGDGPTNLVRERLNQYQFDGTIWTKKGIPDGNLSWMMRQRTYTLPEMYRLCEYLDIDPWYGLTGTVYPEEMDALVEYLAAPADVGWGKVRAAQGHPKPWTDTFDKIYLEFGNEIWNGAGDYPVSSYDGPDYWEGLIRRAKANKYYKSNLVFVMGTDGGYANVPSSDMYMTRAPYVVHDLPQDVVDVFPTKKDLFYYIFAYSQEQNWDGRSINALYEGIKGKGKGIAVYEVHYHMTRPDNTLDVRNEFVTSVAAGVNIVNTMLGQQKRFDVQPQCFFSYKGSFYQTRLWGCVLSDKPGYERYRPSYLALELANKAILPDLLETVQTDTPSFTTKVGRRPDQMDEKTCPTVYSYAYRDGKNRSVILVNLDLTDDRPVELKFSGTPAGKATMRIVTADSFMASNEYEHDVQVQTAESTVALSSGQRITLPACSMVTLTWTESSR